MYSASLGIQFSSVQSLSRVRLFPTPWIAAHQASLSITNSWSLFKLMSSNHLILCHPLFFLPSIFPSISVFSIESVLRISWPKYWSFSFNINLSMNIQDWILLEKYKYAHYSVQSLQLCPTLCDPIDCSIPCLPVHHELPEFTQTYVHWVGNAFQPSHPLSSPSVPAFNLSQHQGLFKWVSSLYQVAEVLEFQLQHQSFQWTLRTDFL